MWMKLGWFLSRSPSQMLWRKTWMKQRLRDVATYVRLDGNKRWGPKVLEERWLVGHCLQEGPCLDLLVHGGAASAGAPPAAPFQGWGQRWCPSLCRWYPCPPIPTLRPPGTSITVISWCFFFLLCFLFSFILYIVFHLIVLWIYCECKVFQEVLGDQSIINV